MHALVLLPALITVLAGLAAPAAAQNAATFRCANRDRVLARHKCDGRDNCGDGSDEAACDAPAAALAVGESVVVQATVESKHSSLFLLACNASECSKIHVYRLGASSEGDLKFRGARRCGWPLWRNCEEDLPTASYLLPVGKLSLVVQRRPSQLAVWPADHPDNVGLVDAPDGDLVVRLRAWQHNEDLRPQFDGLVPTVALPVATLGGHQQQLATAVAGLRRDVDDLRRQLAGLRAEVRAQAQRRP